MFATNMLGFLTNITNTCGSSKQTGFGSTTSTSLVTKHLASTTTSIRVSEYICQLSARVWQQTGKKLQRDIINFPASTATGADIWHAQWTL